MTWWNWESHISLLFPSNELVGLPHRDRTGVLNWHSFLSFRVFGSGHCVWLPTEGDSHFPEPARRLLHCSSIPGNHHPFLPLRALFPSLDARISFTFLFSGRELGFGGWSNWTPGDWFCCRKQLVSEVTCWLTSSFSNDLCSREAIAAEWIEILGSVTAQEALAVNCNYGITTWMRPSRLSCVHHCHLHPSKRSISVHRAWELQS